MKYIDADKLIAEINNRLMSVNLEELGNFGCHRVWAYNDVKDLIASLQQEQPELPPIGYAETYYQRGLHDGIIKGRINILKGLEEIEKRKAEPVLVIKEQEQPDGLDEAANDYCSAYYDWDDEGERKEVVRTFKAGAEWMAGQGSTIKARVDKTGIFQAVITTGLREALVHFKNEEEVIIQIRKK